jgi:DNA polymerase alpha-associated DNA helicase A
LLTLVFPTGIRTGDIVAVAEQPAGSAKKREARELEAKGSRGVVTRVGKGSVWVALDSEDDESPVGRKRLWIVKLANDVTYKRSASFSDIGRDG